MQGAKLGLWAKIYYIGWLAACALIFGLLSQVMDISPLVIIGVTAAGIAAIYAYVTSVSRVVESRPFRKVFKHGTGGSARWGGPGAFAKHVYRAGGDAPIYLGRTLHKYDPRPANRSIGVDDENHLVTIAQSRSGKSTTSIWPNLAQHPYPDSVFVLDPKGEHAKLTSSYRAGQGQTVIIADPFGETGMRSHGFNPLAEIDPNSSRAKEDIAAIADACVIPSESKSDTGDHFEKLQQALISGTIAHILTTLPSDQHNLPAMYDHLMSLGDAARFEEFVTAMANNDACGGAPKEAALMYARAGENERGSIFTTTISNISWIASKGMRDHLLRSDFNLSDLRTKQTSLYVVLDFDAMQAHKQGRYMRLLINMAFEACRRTPLPASRRQRRTLFILDEVAQLGPMPAIENAYRTLAGSHVKIWTFYQNYGALAKTAQSPNDLMGNSTKQFFGCGDPETAQEIEKYLGKYGHVTSSGMERQRSLLDDTEIQDSLGQNAMIQIVITGSGDKMELGRQKFIPKPGGQTSQASSESTTNENSRPALEPLGVVGKGPLRNG